MITAARIVAHRGSWGGAVPQNSLAAYERAIENGADALELDVRRTADGRLVAVHDARVLGRSVSRLTLDELRARLRPGQAPLLEEVLELAAGRIALDVELKEPGCAAEAAARVAARLPPDAYVITSFADRALTAARGAAPDARHGLLLAPRRQTRELEGRLRVTGADFVAPHAGLARAGLLAWMAERGLRAWVWTVNDRRALRQLLGDPRVEAVITDRVPRALAERTAASAEPAATRSASAAARRRTA